MGQLIEFPPPKPKLSPEEMAVFVQEIKQNLARNRERREASATDDPA